MKDAAHTRSRLVVFLALVALSAISMVWSIWHHPIGTGIATLGVLCAFGISARLARAIDVDSGVDHDRGNQRA